MIGTEKLNQEMTVSQHVLLFIITAVYPEAVFRISISFNADPDPGSQKCPYGSGSWIRIHESKI